MASGFELAGVVLAAFPIVVKGLGAYVDGVQAIKYWRRYGWELRSYARRLRSQRVRYINTLELLFDGVLESEDELATLVNDPAGASWHEPRYDKMLRSRLDHSYEHFLDTLDSMMIMLRDLAAKLDISEDGKVGQVCIWRTHTLLATGLTTLDQMGREVNHSARDEADEPRSLQRCLQ